LKAADADMIGPSLPIKVADIAKTGARPATDD
jgi:hypothetical protein